MVEAATAVIGKERVREEEPGRSEIEGKDWLVFYGLGPTYRTTPSILYIAWWSKAMSNLLWDLAKPQTRFDTLLVLLTP